MRPVLRNLGVSQTHSGHDQPLAIPEGNPFIACLSPSTPCRIERPKMNKDMPQPALEFPHRDGAGR